MVLLYSSALYHGCRSLYSTPLHSTMAQLDTTSLHWTLLYTIPQVYLDLLDSTTLYHGSTWLYFTLLHSHHGFTWFYLALPDPTWLYYTLPWLYLTLLHKLHSTMALQDSIVHSTMALPGSTWLYYYHSSTLVYYTLPCLPLALLDYNTLFHVSHVSMWQYLTLRLLHATMAVLGSTASTTLYHCRSGVGTVAVVAALAATLFRP